MRKTLLAILALAVTSAAFAGIVNLRLGLGHGAQLAPVNCSSIPLTCPLVQSSDTIFTFLGSFKAPATFAYMGGSMSTSGTTMYFSGAVTTNAGVCYGEGSFAIPTLSGAPAYDGSNAATATAIVLPTVPVDGSNNPTINWGDSTGCGGTNGNIFTGSLVYGGKLYLTGGYSFDSSKQITSWILSASTNLTGFGTPNGASTSNGTYPRFFAGPLGLVPATWQPYLGGPAYVASASQGATFSITTSSPAGFLFATFDPATVVSGGGNVSLTELLDYYWQGTDYQPETEQLSYRSFSGPFGSAIARTLASSLTGGATSATLSTAFQPPYPAEQSGGTYLYQMTFSDGETRNAALTVGSTSVPSTGTFTALTCSGGCTTSVTIKPYGDNYVTEYDGALGYGFFVPGSRSFLYISQHSYGPLANRFGSNGTTGTSPCDPNGNASSNNDAPWSPDTNAYRQLQITAYDVTNFYNAKQGNQAVYAANPYAFWTFPGASNLLVSAQPGQAQGCINIGYPGAFYFDPSTNILYGSVANAPNNGNNIIYEWSVSGT